MQSVIYKDNHYKAKPCTASRIVQMHLLFLRYFSESEWGLNRCWRCKDDDDDDGGGDDAYLVVFLLNMSV